MPIVNNYHIILYIYLNEEYNKVNEDKIKVIRLTNNVILLNIHITLLFFLIK